jgi:hypothetical protein
MSDIFGVRVTAELNILDSLIIICNNLGGQTEPAVTFAGTNYFVAWLDGAFAKLNTDVKVSRVDPQGAVLGNGVPIGIGDERPDIAYDNDRCLVVWSQEFNGVLGRFVNASGQPEGQEFLITLTQGTSTIPLVEYGAGHYLVVWPDFCPAGTDLDIFGQIVSPTGQLLGDQIKIAQGTSIQNYPSIAFDGNAFLVVWVEDAATVYGRYISENGVPIGEGFPISNNTTYERQSASVKAGENKFLVAWNEYHDAFDVYGNLDVPTTGIEETTVDVPCGKLITQSNGIKRVLTGREKLYDILGRRVSVNNITPGIYFVGDENETLLKVVIIH